MRNIEIGDQIQTGSRVFNHVVVGFEPVFNGPILANELGNLFVGYIHRDTPIIKKSSKDYKLSDVQKECLNRLTRNAELAELESNFDSIFE